MVALHHGAAATATAAFHRRRPMPENISLVKPIFFISSFSTSSPVRHARRRNHLRQKILKTLENPLIPKLPPGNPISPIESPPREIDVNQAIEEVEKTENSGLAGGEGSQGLQELKHVEVSLPAGVGIDGRISVAGQNSFLKYGLWFLGAFVFQTICAVMIFGLDENNNKKEIVDGRGEFSAKDDVLDGNVKVGLRDGYVNVDNLEMELKIEEIRLMAREVRERERLQSNGNGEDGDESEEGKHIKSEIEEEVDGSMFRLKKKLEKTRFKTPLGGHSGGETKRKDEVDNGDLLYKKKYKFKDFSFIGPDISRVNGDVEGEEVSGNGDDNVIEAVEGDNKKGTLETTEVARNTRSKVAKEWGASKQVKRKGVAKPKLINGNVEMEAVKSRKADVEGVKSGKSSNIDAAVVSSKLSKGNGSFRGKGFGNTKAGKSKSESLWWWNLPYVLVIFMRRGSGGEGLYTLKSSPSSSREDQPSYTVAFEDRADATNFCYLMESFFEDLGDFKADVVPLSVQELKEAEESYSLRALVVKKGQLQLYAGQPLTDAEMELRTMIEQII